MKLLRFALPVLCAVVALTGCETLPTASPTYNPPAHRPHNPDAVRVKVSLKNQAVYVLENGRPLLVTATCVGMPGHATRTGDFRVTEKVVQKRSGSYGFSISGDTIRPCEAGEATGAYKGYPMPYWVEFTPGYGFHEGYVWPVPRTHGCLRLHKEAAAKFYALVKEGTPINIATSQPEDETIGKNLARPTDYRDPDPAASYMISDGPFSGPKGPLFVD